VVEVPGHDLFQGQGLKVVGGRGEEEGRVDTVGAYFGGVPVKVEKGVGFSE
jgi:hypothetical protein